MEEQVTIPVELLGDLIDAASCYLFLVQDGRDGLARPEKHPDWSSVEYLEGEARFTIDKAKQYMPKLEEQKESTIEHNLPVVNSDDIPF